VRFSDGGIEDQCGLRGVGDPHRRDRRFAASREAMRTKAPQLLCFQAVTFARCRKVVLLRPYRLYLGVAGAVSVLAKKGRL
jgi:hypothetical protein